MSIAKAMWDGAKAALADALKSYAVPVGIALVEAGLQAMHTEIEQKASQLAALDEQLAARRAELEHQGPAVFDVNEARTANRHPHDDSAESIAAATRARMPYTIHVTEGDKVEMAGRPPVKFLGVGERDSWEFATCPETGLWLVDADGLAKKITGAAPDYRADPVDDSPMAMGYAAVAAAMSAPRTGPGIDVSNAAREARRPRTEDDELESASVASDAQQAAEDYDEADEIGSPLFTPPGPFGVMAAGRADDLDVPPTFHG